ncbi:YqaJ viral recombinase family protein (plasmid) [Methylomonas sp. MS20]|uniref:YqaJ viral recombinase family nuclease n=1 Tax=Methylomonas sp. MS20 TaxID=3418769 RepID=UPI003CFC454A
MKIVDIAQRSDAWRRWRSQGVTASEAAIILNRSPYKTPWRLWAERVGIVLEANLDHHPLVRRGRELESQAAQWFETTLDELLLPLCGECDQYPLIRASFDGMTGNGEPVEIKCPHPSTYQTVVREREQSAAYQLYWVQVQQQLLVADAKRGYLCFYLDDQHVKVFDIARDDAFLVALINATITFYGWVMTKKEPPKDLQRDLYLPQGDAETQWRQLAAEYRARQKKLEALKAEAIQLAELQAKTEAEWVAQMADYVIAEHSGVRVCRSVSQGGIDYRAALTALLPQLTEAELAPYRKAPASRVRVTCRDDNGKNAQVAFDPASLAVTESSWF